MQLEKHENTSILQLHWSSLGKLLEGFQKFLKVQYFHVCF